VQRRGAFGVQWRIRRRVGSQTPSLAPKRNAGRFPARHRTKIERNPNRVRACPSIVRGLFEQLSGGAARHFEGGGESQRNLCGQTELADFVIGNDSLDDVDALGLLSLAESLQAALFPRPLFSGHPARRLSSFLAVWEFGAVAGCLRESVRGHCGDFTRLRREAENDIIPYIEEKCCASTTRIVGGYVGTQNAVVALLRRRVVAFVRILFRQSFSTAIILNPRHC
jgi:hypothetical protein